jgi:two-component system, NtrC family, response regulator HydG
VRTKILILEDQFIEANNLRGILKNEGYEVLPLASSVPEALVILKKETPDLVLLDIYLDGPQTGIDLAGILKSRGIAFVYLSANSDRAILEKAKATEPYGFLVKPFRKKDVLVTLEIARYLHEHRRKVVAGQDAMSPAGGIPAGVFDSIIGGSAAVKTLLKKVSIVGPSDTSVLLLGENGTGKELVAQALHRVSSRRQQALITVNCAALPASLIESELFGHEKGAFTGATERRIGKFDQAHGGTIFLDEIGELPPNMQAKFLRVLQEREIEPIGGKKKKIDVRVIAATNRNLEEEIAQGNFRMDLYFRLSVFPLLLRPLRERKEDIPLLAAHFLRRYSEKEGKLINGLSKAVLQEMQKYNWPGNVRELENFIARSVLLAEGQVIELCDLPVVHEPAIPAAGGEQGLKSMRENEKEHILAALKSCNGKLYGAGGAAELLKVNASTLRSRMKNLGIDKKKRQGST